MVRETQVQAQPVQGEICRSERLATRAAIIERLAALRPAAKELSAQVSRTCDGVPWLGWTVFENRLRLKGRKVRHARRHLHARLAAYHAGRISFGEFDASVRSWIAHAAHGDSWRLRTALLGDLVIEHARAERARRRP